MATGAAPNDPIFWPIHPLFEKAWQGLRLSPKYAQQDVAWKNHASSECNGTDFDGAGGITPFESLFDDDGQPYTNRELWHLFKPDGDDIPCELCLEGVRANVSALVQRSYSKVVQYNESNSVKRICLNVHIHKVYCIAF